MNDAMDRMKKTKEDLFFQQKEEEKLAALTRRGTQRLVSPITGGAMSQEVIHGITIDRCVDTGGVWLDAGELEELLRVSEQGSNKSMLSEFISSLIGEKK